MDIESLQAAQLGFDAYVEQRSRVAETAPSLLMQSEVELVQLRAEEINQRNNHALLTDFTQALPPATTGAFLADSVQKPGRSRPTSYGCSGPTQMVGRAHIIHSILWANALSPKRGTQVRDLT